MSRVIRYSSRILCGSLLLACSGTPLSALNPERRADSYSVQGWSTSDGLPSNKIRAFAQTKDGYLWVATAQGVARFDGRDFTFFSGVTNPELRGGGFFAVQEAPDGSLWFGGDRGLFRWRQGQFEQFTTEEGLAHNYVRALGLTRDGAIVACTRSGYSFVRGDRIDTPGGEWKKVRGVARSYFETTEGTILLGTDEGLWQVRGDEVTELSGGSGRFPGNGFTSLLGQPDGSYYIGFSGGLRRVYPDGKVESFGVAEGLEYPRIASLRNDRDGNLWIGTYGGGLYRMSRGKIERARYPAKIGATIIQQIMEDREGSLWVATATGLFQVKDNIGGSVGTREGLAQTAVFSVLETAAGSWMIGIWGDGVYRFDQQRATRVPIPASLGLEQVLSFAEQSDGTLWIGANNGLYRHNDRETVNLYRSERAAAGLAQLAANPEALLASPAHARVNSIAIDQNGALWVATDGALYHGNEGRFRAYTTADGLPGNIFKAVIQARDGSVWATVPPFGVVRFSAGRWTNFLCGRDISDIYPRAVYEDRTGTIWVTTEGGGLSRFKNDKWRTFTASDGLVDDFISGFVEDDLGNFWIACPRGIMRIPRGQFDEIDAGQRSRLQPRFFNSSDGLPAGETNQQGLPNAWRTRDGRLLFATDHGVAVIEPASLKLNELVPPVLIEGFSINGVAANLANPVVVPPGDHDLRVDFTAICLLAPEKVRYKIRLSPVDPDWVDMGGRTDMRYAQLRPGRYRFQVIACNNDGVWNERGAELAFEIRPFFIKPRGLRVSWGWGCWGWLSDFTGCESDRRGAG